MNTAIKADYLGGDPRLIGEESASGRLAIDAGGLRFLGGAGDATRPINIEVSLESATLEAVSVCDQAALVALRGGPIGPALAIEGPLAEWLSPGRAHVLLAACRREGTRFLCAFGVRPDDGLWLLRQLGARREEMGDPPLPPLEALVEWPEREALGPEERILALLEEIRDLLRDQNRLLRRPPRPRRGGRGRGGSGGPDAEDGSAENGHGAVAREEQRED